MLIRDLTRGLAMIFLGPLMPVQFGSLALANLVALMGNYAGTAELLTTFDMQLDPDRPLPLPQL